MVSNFASIPGNSEGGRAPPALTVASSASKAASFSRYYWFSLYISYIPERISYIPTIRDTAQSGVSILVDGSGLFGEVRWLRGRKAQVDSSELEA